MEKADRAALAAHLVRHLRQVGSYASSTHVRSCLFLAQEEHVLDLGYAFVILRYAPFSVELDSELAEWRSEGILRASSDGGHVRYDAGPTAPDLAEHLVDKGQIIERVAGIYGGMRAQDLDVYATTFFVAKRRSRSTDADIVAQVLRIKPHVSPGAVQEALEKLTVRS